MSLVFLVFLCLPAALVGERFLLYRVIPNDDVGLAALEKLSRMDHKYKVDFWKEPSRVGEPGDVMISEKWAERLERRFRRDHVNYTIAVPDVEKLIRRNEGSSSFSKRLKDDPILDSEPDLDHSRVGHLKKAKYPFGDYASYADMMKYMRTIEFYYPNITKIVRLGTTHEGKPIEGLKIGRSSASSSSSGRRAIWIDGNIHAREWASSHTALFFINQLVSGYGKDDTITHYVDSIDFFVVPCLNPDGYEYTRSSPMPNVRLWRKNRSPEKCQKSVWGGERCCQGVDLNRNFRFHWSETGSSFEPCSNIYHGETVFSEPEARAVRDFLSSPSMAGRVDAFVTLHSYAQLWIYPYSHLEQSYPEDIAQLVTKTARKAINRLQRMYGTQYRMGTGADTLAPAAGGSDDWAKSEMGIKFVYLVELRPEMELSNGFILHKKELIPTAVETWEGIKEVIEAVLEQNGIRNENGKRISANLRKKQMFRMRLLGMANGNEGRNNTSSKKDEKKVTSSPSDFNLLPTRPRPWLSTTTEKTTQEGKEGKTTQEGKEEREKEGSRRMLETATEQGKTTWKSKHFERLTTQPSDVSSTATAAPPPTTPHRASAFYANTQPISFRDPDCRDMRYSCAFWLRSNSLVCEEQLSFMKAQCAYTCKFCTSKLKLH